MTQGEVCLIIVLTNLKLWHISVSILYGNTRSVLKEVMSPLYAHIGTMFQSKRAYYARWLPHHKTMVPSIPPFYKFHPKINFLSFSHPFIIKALTYRNVCGLKEGTVDHICFGWSLSKQIIHSIKPIYNYYLFFFILY